MPDSVEAILREYFSLVTKHAPHLLAGFYLHGSIALKAFDERCSDIDFVAILNWKPAAADLKALTAVHREVAIKYPKPQLEGSYLQWGDLGRFPEELEPYPSFHDGRMCSCGYHNANSVTWWILKHHGIAVIGPEPEALDFTVDRDLLIKNTVANLNTYWRAWTRNPWRMKNLLVDDGIQWAVLGISRLLYALEEGDIVSKVRAGKYALSRVPPKWHQVIQESLDIRSGTRASHCRSRITRARDAVGFLKYVIERYA